MRFAEFMRVAAHEMQQGLVGTFGGQMLGGKDRFAPAPGFDQQPLETVRLIAFDPIVHGVRLTGGGASHARRFADPIGSPQS